MQWLSYEIITIHQTIKITVVLNTVISFIDPDHIDHSILYIASQTLYLHSFWLELEKNHYNWSVVAKGESNLHTNNKYLLLLLSNQYLVQKEVVIMS